MPPSFDAAEFRAQFPALKNVVYLNTSTAPPGSVPVLEAMRNVERSWEEGVFSWIGWEEEAASTRAKFGELIGGAPAHSVALLSSLSEAAATVASCLASQSSPGRVVVADHEFRSNLWPWLALEQRGWEVARVPPRGEVVTTDAYLEHLIPGTQLVAISAVHSANGYRPDLGAIAERAREVGARLFVNLTQLLGALQFDFAGSRPDYIAAHGYKWMLGPRGAAWLYVRPDRLAEMGPLAPSWKNSAHPLADYYGGHYDLAPDARRLDGSLAWFPWVGAGAALDMLLSLDRDAVEKRCLALASAFRTEASRLGFPCTPVELPSQIVSLTVDEPGSLIERLSQNRVIAAVRDAGVRVGFHAFNDESDVEAALDALSRRD